MRQSIRRLKIYQTRLHLVATLIFLALPFVFLLVFSGFTNITKVVLFKDLATSLARIAVAYLIAAFLGWLFAVSFFRGKRSNFFLPLFDVLQSFPTYAALPLAVLHWGSTNFTVIFFLVVAIIWPVFFSIISSLKLIRRDWEEAVEISRISGFSYLKKFLWPISMPGLVTGSIVGLGDGWEALVATEIIVRIRPGLGQFFDSFSSNPQITFFGIFGVMLLIFSINKIIWLPLLNKSHQAMED